jgi:hypothetical protein
MKLYGFNGTQTAFEIRLEDDIEVTYCDFTLRPDYIKIHSIEFVHDEDADLVNLEILAKTMYEYIDWNEMQQDAFDTYQQACEDNMREL